jgi:hypothetical protein
MTLLDVINRVKQYSHRGNIAITNDAETQKIIDCINEAYWEMALQVPKQAFRTDSVINGTDINIVANTEIYSLAGNPYPVQELINVNYIFLTINYNVKKIESEQEFWRQFFVANASHNRPFIYCPWGFDANGVKQIRVFPIPDQSYTVHYEFFVDPTTVALTTANLNQQIPFFPSYLQRPLWKGALYYYLKGFDDVQMAQMAKMDYDQSRLQQNIAEDADLDSDLQFRYDMGRTRFVDPATGIRLQ